MSDRDYKTSAERAEDRRIAEINALTRQRQLALEQEQLEREQAFLQPTGLQQLAGPVQGLDVSYGTQAGGSAFYLPVDFGANVIPKDYFRGQGEAMMPQQVDPNMIDPLDDLEQVAGYTDVYYENVNKLNDMANKAARLGFDITKPDAFNPDQLALHRAYNDLKDGTLQLGWQLKHGREDVKTGLQRGMLFEQHQGATVGTRDTTDPKMLDADLIQANKMMKTYYDTGAFADAEAYYNDVVAGWEQRAEEAKARGDFKEEETFRRKILALNKPTMDYNQILNRKLAKDKLAHEKEQAYQKQSGKFKPVYDLYKYVFQLQSKNDTSFLAGSKYKTREDGEGRWIYDPTNPNLEPVNVNNADAVVALLAESGGEFFDRVDPQLLQEYKAAGLEFHPDEDINMNISANTESYFNLFSDLSGEQYGGRKAINKNKTLTMTAVKRDENGDIVYKKDGKTPIKITKKINGEDYANWIGEALSYGATYEISQGNLLKVKSHKTRVDDDGEVTLILIGEDASGKRKEHKVDWTPDKKTNMRIPKALQTINYSRIQDKKFRRAASDESRVDYSISQAARGLNPFVIFYETGLTSGSSDPTSIQTENTTIESKSSSNTGGEDGNQTQDLTKYDSKK